jgi:hypothetical protein
MASKKQGTSASAGSLEFNKLPEELSEDDINGYLTALALSPKSPSRSSFKHAIYGLRYYYRLSDKPRGLLTCHR